MIESPVYPYSMQYIEEVAAYVRVSTTEQKLHGLSVLSQVQKLTDYAEANHMKIVEWYIDDGVSGRKPIKKRPELQRMLNDAKSGKFKRIIFIKLDRYFRSVAEFHESQKILDEAKVTWTATEEKYDMSTANGRAFVNMKVVISELEADTAGERVKIVNEYKVREGMPLTSSFPFCYRVGEPEEGERHKYVAKQDEEIMEDLIAHVMVNRSIRAATLYINNKYNRNFGYNAIRGALRNEMICGSYKGNPNYCEPYITREMYEELQKIIRHNPRTSQYEHAYFFTGLIRCPHCGNRLAGSSQTQKWNEKKQIYYMYRCNRYRRDRSCTFSAAINEKKFEEMMLREIEGIVEDQRITNIEIRKAEDQVSKYDVKALQEELDRLNYAWKKGRIKNVEEYDRDYEELVRKIEEANTDRAEIEDPDYEKIKAVLQSGWKGIYAELDDEHKRTFWRSFVEEIQIEWTKENKTITEVKFF